MKAFEYDSGFMKFAILLSRLTLLNLIWLIACIPVVTIGASTAAMHYSAAKLMNGDSHVFGNYKTGFRTYWKKRNCDLADHRSIQCHLRYGILPVPDSTYSLSYGTDGHLRHGFPYIIISSDLDLSDNGEFLRKVTGVIFQCIYLRFYVRTCHTDRSGILMESQDFYLSASCSPECS